MPMHLKIGDNWLEGDAALQKARDFSQVLNQTGPLEGANRIADTFTKELTTNGEAYDPKSIKSILDSYPESRQTDAASLYTRFGIEPGKKSVGAGSERSGGETPGATGPNAAEPPNTGLATPVPGGVRNTGPEPVQATSTQANTATQAPGNGQAPGGPGGQAPGPQMRPA